MNRELVLTVLALDLGGSAYVLSGIGSWPVGQLGQWHRRRSRAKRRPGPNGLSTDEGLDDGLEAEADEVDPVVPPLVTPLSTFELERRAWRKIWAPLWPCLGVFAFLFGWAVHEPENGAQALPVLAFLLALPFALLAMRATLRAVRSAAAAAKLAANEPLAVTVGLWRPRTLISPILRSALDAAAFTAVREHEAAHARHHDPLRVWLAQLVTDLQWPVPSARRRFSQWRVALELARDDEARARGVDGGDLAAGLLAVARLGSVAGVRAEKDELLAGAGLAMDVATHAFTQRVSRLLMGEQPTAAALEQQLVEIPRAGAMRRLLGHGLHASLLGSLMALGYSYGSWVVSTIAHF